MNKKGITQMVNQIIVILTLFIVVVLIIGGFWAISLAGPIIYDSTKSVNGQIGNVMQKANENIPQRNINESSQAIQSTIDMTDRIMDISEWFSYLLFLGMIIAFIGICFFVRTYPFIGIIWIFVIIASVFISMILSNAYTTSAQGPLSSVYTQWEVHHFFMTFLPHIMATFGVVSGLILLILISKEPEAEVNVL